MMKKLVFCMLFMPAMLRVNAQHDIPLERKYEVHELQSDLRELRAALEKSHPNLYLYTPKAELDRYFDSLNAGISAPLTDLEFYAWIAPLHSRIKDGHTIMLPPSATVNRHSARSKFLPYHFTIRNHALWVDMVLTGDAAIPPGAEILQINGISAGTLIDTLVAAQVRDGANGSYPEWILNNYLREFYSYIFGHPEWFVLSFRTHSGSGAAQASVRALSKDSISFYKEAKYAHRVANRKLGSALTLRFLDNNRCALLTVRDFHNSVLRKDYHQKFRQEIPRLFARIQSSKVGALILDLRDNQGGDLANGILLLSYLTDSSFTAVDSYYKTDRRGQDKPLRKTRGPGTGPHMPKAKAFHGKLLVLINGGSFSNTGIVSAALRRANRGIFIGTETGGNAQVLAGNVRSIILTHTRMQVELPTKRFLLDGRQPLAGRGIIPDYSITPSIAAVINGADPVLDLAVNLADQ